MLNLENIIGTVAGICTSVSMLPQLVKMVEKKEATDISLKMLLLLSTGVGLWVWYGVMKKDWPIIVTNSFSVLVNLAIIYLRARYKEKK